MDRTVLKPDPTKGPGCYAPPVDDETLDRYQELATKCEREEIFEAMMALITMLRIFRETPESTHPGVELRTNFHRGLINGKRPPKIVPLEKSEVNRMWDYVPWPHEIRALEALFATIPNETQKELRDAAFHLKWFAGELALDREPMTQDKMRAVRE